MWGYLGNDFNPSHLNSKDMLSSASAFVGHSDLPWRKYDSNREIIVAAARNEPISLRELTRVMVSQSLREKILTRYPILREHNGHRAFVGYLLFTSFRGKDNRPVLEGQRVLRCYNAQEAYPDRIRVIDILDVLRRDVLSNLKWTVYKPGVGCREAYETGVDKDILQAVGEELRSRPDRLETPLLWQTGKRISEKEKSLIRRRQAEGIRESEGTAEASRRWAQYLNSRPANPFSEVQGRFADAWKKAESYENKERREGELRHLRRFHLQPKPIYRYSPNTVRIIAKNSLQTIGSELRRILTGDLWTEYDLKSAQLAIAAVEWDVPEVVRFLKSGGDIWKSFSAVTGLPMEYKPVFKKGLYSTAYGSPQATVRRKHMRRAAKEKRLPYHPDEEGKRILDHPFFRKLIPARDRRMDKIQDAGGAKDVFGRWISVEKVRKSKDCGESKAVRSVLAQMNQAIEMDLITPVLNLAEAEEAKARRSWQITLYQYDGFSVKYHRSRDYHHQRIVQAVHERAKAGGYPTRLEVQHSRAL